MYKKESKTLYQRFVTKFKKVDSGCWEWIAALNSKGYGALMNENKITDQAHVISYRLFIGEPNGLFVCHHCDNPKCVNPMHLFLGTHQDNMDDKIRKGRHGNGLAPIVHPSARHYELGCRCDDCKKLKSDKGKAAYIKKKYMQNF